MLIQNKYPYRNLEKVDTPVGRRYSVDGEYLPSVTTILSATADTTHIDTWVKNVGQDKANKIKDEASVLGTAMHLNLENYIEGRPQTGSFMAKALASVIIKMAMPHVEEIWGNEVNLYYPRLYAGTTDLVGVFKSVPSIMDFKNSISEKSEDRVLDYYLQVCAYAMSHNHLYGTNINQGVIFIATRDAKYQEYVINGDKFDYYTDMWVRRLTQYYEQ